jgi:hypothetical protein
MLSSPSANTRRTVVLVGGMVMITADRAASSRNPSGASPTLDEVVRDLAPGIVHIRGEPRMH